jgi:hypothetical protein
LNNNNPPVFGEYNTSNRSTKSNTPSKHISIETFVSISPNPRFYQHIYPKKNMSTLSNVTNTLSQIPTAAIEASEAVLNSAIKAVGLDTPTEIEGEAEKKKEDGDGKELEDGEIEDGEEGGVKTVFDDPASFNVKVCVFFVFLPLFPPPPPSLPLPLSLSLSHTALTLTIRY